MNCDTCGKEIKSLEPFYNPTMFHGGKSECLNCYKKHFNQCDCGVWDLRKTWNYCPMCGKKVVK